MEQFEELKSKIMNLSATDVSVRLLRRRILGSANVCEFDAQGRIMVPAPVGTHRCLARRRSMLIDVFSKIEICSSAFFEPHASLKSLAEWIFLNMTSRDFNAWHTCPLEETIRFS